MFVSADYPQWEVPKQERMTARNDYVPPTTPFEGNSRYKSDFPMHGRTPRESCKPIENTIKSDAPFEGMTEARKSYVQHVQEPTLDHRHPKSRQNTVTASMNVIQLGL